MELQKDHLLITDTKENVEGTGVTHFLRFVCISSKIERQILRVNFSSLMVHLTILQVLLWKKYWGTVVSNNN